ncbi:MarC family protein [Candidatus Woesearchaeota archaeon]|nr:MarC family protein [Candidatus Woesearchaeota archaeon]
MEKLLEAFITLFVIMDPVGILPIFIGLAKGMPSIEIRKNINKSVLVAGVLLFIFLFFGVGIFSLFGIDLTSFQIAGGIILLVMGVMSVLGVMGRFIKTHGNDLSVPVGTPLLTGPGVLAVTIILVNENGPYVTAIAAILALSATWIILSNSSRIYRILGEHWTTVISRIMGIILAAIAVGLITDGVSGIIS